MTLYQTKPCFINNYSKNKTRKKKKETKRKKGKRKVVLKICCPEKNIF